MLSETVNQSTDNEPFTSNHTRSTSCSLPRSLSCLKSDRAPKKRVVRKGPSHSLSTPAEVTRTPAEVTRTPAEVTRTPAEVTRSTVGETRELDGGGESGLRDWKSDLSRLSSSDQPADLSTRSRFEESLSINIPKHCNTCACWCILNCSALFDIK